MERHFFSIEGSTVSGLRGDVCLVVEFRCTVCNFAPRVISDRLNHNGGVDAEEVVFGIASEQERDLINLTNRFC